MVSQRLFDELNKQMNFEFYSAHLYLAKAAYCASLDLNGFANFFTVQAEEERFHAMKFYNFINEMNGRVMFEGIHQPKNEYTSLLDVYKEAYEHEKIVTKRIYTLMDIATEEREHATISFLKWFIDEQVEEESTFDTLIKNLDRIKDDPAAVYMLDKESSTRTFTPPAEA